LVFYGNIAEVAINFEKGDNIHVTAFLEHREWETKAGSKRNTYEVVVKKCHRIAGVKGESPAADTDQAESELSPTRSLESAHADQTDDEWVV
jgi:single-strand DNA-binding protein